MYFVDVEHEQLDALKQGLEILERLGSESMPKLYLFGLAKSDAGLTSQVKEAVAEEHDYENLTPDKIPVGAIAIIIPISSDVLYLLTGSGMKLTDEEFVYNGGREGTQTGSFRWLRGPKPQVTINSFAHMGLADDEYGADRFLQQYGSQAPAAPASHPVQRTEPSATSAPGAAPVVEEKKSSAEKDAGAYAVMSPRVDTWFDPLLRAVDEQGRHGDKIIKERGELAFREWVQALAKKIGVPKGIRESVSKEVASEILEF